MFRGMFANVQSDASLQALLAKLTAACQASPDGASFQGVSYGPLIWAPLILVGSVLWAPVLNMVYNWYMLGSKLGAQTKGP